MEFNVILAGDPICEVGALRKSLADKSPVAIPDAPLLLPSSSPQPEPHISLTAPEKMVCQASSDLTMQQVQLNIYCTSDALNLPSFAPRPHVVVLCFNAVSPKSFERMTEVWGRAIDRMYPRPTVCVCATRSDALANRRVLDHLKREKTVPIDVEEACDNVIRLRAVSYTEVSALHHVNMTMLLNSIAKACLGEAERRATPDVVGQMRQACVQAHMKTLSIWSSRRDNNGKLFYFNRETKKAQWKRPSDYDGDEPELTTEERVELELQRQADEERKLLLDREQSMLQVFQKEIQEHHVRIQEGERRLGVLNEIVGRLSVQATHVKSEIAENEHEREILERKKEEALRENALFAKDSVDVDRSMDRDIQSARARLFELEMISALRAEEQFDGDIAESLMINKGLASRLRETLEAEVEAQKQSAKFQSKYDAISIQREQAAQMLATLTSKIVATKEKRAASLEELNEAMKKEKAVAEMVRTLRDEEGIHDAVEIERHRKQMLLLRESQHLDAQIARAKLVKHQDQAGASSSSSALEHERLSAQQKVLLAQLAKSASQAACDEIEVKRLLIEFNYAFSEYERVTSVLSRLRKQLVLYYETECEVMVSGKHYTPISKSAMHAEIAQVELAIRAMEKPVEKHKAETILAALKERQALAMDVESVHNAGRQATRDERILATRVAERTAASHQIIADAERCLSSRTASGSTPLESLLAMAGPVLGNDPIKMKSIVDQFTSLVLGHVSPAELTREEVSKMMPGGATSSSADGSPPSNHAAKRWGKVAAVVAAAVRPSLSQRGDAVANTVSELNKTTAEYDSLAKQLNSQYSDPNRPASSTISPKAKAKSSNEEGPLAKPVLTSFRRKMLAKARSGTESR